MAITSDVLKLLNRVKKEMKLNEDEAELVEGMIEDEILDCEENGYGEEEYDPHEDDDCPMAELDDEDD